MHRVSMLLERLQQSFGAGGLPDASAAILKEARAIVDGLDPYLEQCSMKPPPVLAEMIKVRGTNLLAVAGWPHGTARCGRSLLLTRCSGH